MNIYWQQNSNYHQYTTCVHFTGSVKWFQRRHSGLSRGHTTNKCWPTCVCQQSWQTKVCRVFKKLANILCLPAMFAVYELVRFLLANKRQTMHCDWLAVVNIMTQNGRMHLALTTIILPHFTSTLSTTASKQISGAYIFAYEQLNKSLQQRRRRLLRPPSPPYCCPTKLCRVWHICLPTIVCQQLLANICWSCVCGFTSCTDSENWQTELRLM